MKAPRKKRNLGGPAIKRGNAHKKKRQRKNEDDVVQEAFASALDEFDISVIPDENRRCYELCELGSQRTKTLEIKYVLQEQLEEIPDDHLMCLVPLSVLLASLTREEAIENTLVFFGNKREEGDLHCKIKHRQALIDCTECDCRFLMDQENARTRQVEECRLRSFCLPCFSKGMRMQEESNMPPIINGIIMNHVVQPQPQQQPQEEEAEEEEEREEEEREEEEQEKK